MKFAESTWKHAVTSLALPPALDVGPHIDVCTPAVSIPLGSGDTAMFVVAGIIVLIASIPFMGGGRRG